MKPKTYHKLYVEPRTAIDARIDYYMFLVATVICLCLAGAFSLLAYVMRSELSLTIGIIVFVPVMALFAIAVLMWKAMRKYKRDWKRLEAEDREAAAGKTEAEKAEAEE